MLSADGCVETAVPDDSGCCPPPLCGNDLCCTFVAFFNLLPSGPLWDYWKAAAISYFQSNEDPAQCPLITDPACPSLVLHAIYSVLKLRAMVHTALWPAFRESSAYTAVTTLDYHLERAQWEDCYNTHCRSVMLGELSPMEVMGVCGPIFCPPDFPPELECALKRNIAIALSRANMGVIRNLCGLNWIVAPLGVEIKPVFPVVCVDPPDEFDPDPETCVEVEEPYCEDCDPVNSPCSTVAFEVCPTQDWIYGCGPDGICETQVSQPKIPAYYEYGCDRPAGLPEKVWPAALAAECIIRSMMPPTCPSNITHCC